MIHDLSRYRWCEIHLDEAGRRFLGPRPRFEYRELDDNSFHTIEEGQRLWHLAQIYYRGVRRAGNLWWVIADFQPEPILDATLTIEPGTIIIVPSLRTVESQVFAPDRPFAA